MGVGPNDGVGVGDIEIEIDADGVAVELCVGDVVGIIVMVGLGVGYTTLLP